MSAVRKNLNFLNSMFAHPRESLFALDKDTKLSAEKAELIADIAEHLTDQPDANKAMKYIANHPNLTRQILDVK